MSDLRGVRVAVTGATGFLGRYIVDALLARQAEVVGVVRRPDRVPQLREKGVELRKADLAELDRLAMGFEGCRFVVSNAALFSVGKMNWDDHEKTNVLGTENVMCAAKAAGVERVLHVSSIAVYKRKLWGNGVTTEGSPQLARSDRNAFNAYYVTKALSEQAAWRIAEEKGIALTTVRPGPIFGAHDPNTTAILARVFRLPIALVPVGMVLPLVYGGDVADAIARALERPETIGKAYNTAGDSDVSLWTLADVWRRTGGRSAFGRLPLPVPFSLRIDNSRAYTELGWSNRAVDEALAETFRLQPSLRASTAHGELTS
jgi:nucleoside-diphosphate-sugar epimerase